MQVRTYTYETVYPGSHPDAHRLFVASSDATSLLADTLISSDDFSLEQHRDQVKALQSSTQEGLWAEGYGFPCKDDKWKQGRWNTISCWHARQEHGSRHCLGGTELCPLEFQDALWIWYCKTPLDRESTCESCGKPFDVTHMMSCKKGDLVSWWCKAGKKWWIALSQLAYGKSSVGNKPNNFNGCSTSSSASSAGTTVADLSTPTSSSALGENAC